MKKLFLIQIIISLAVSSYSQDISIGFQSGFGTYRMSELKEFNKIILRQIPFDAELVAGYPAWFYYRPEISFSNNNLRTGLRLVINSTGSRISYRDYSGAYTFDTRVKAFSPGFFVDALVWQLTEKANFYASCEAGIIFSTLKIDELLVIGEEENRQPQMLLRSINFSVDPGAKFVYSLTPVVALSLNAGYVIQFGKGYFTSIDNEAISYGSDDDAASPDWSGLRVGISAIISFK
jgi:hypothetical protein